MLKKVADVTYLCHCNGEEWLYNLCPSSFETDWANGERCSEGIFLNRFSLRTLWTKIAFHVNGTSFTVSSKSGGEDMMAYVMSYYTSFIPEAWNV
jgi:hypothetical protein